MRLLSIVFLICILPFSTKAHAWGWDGHRLICALAETRLTEEAKDMVARLLAEGSELKGGVVNFPEACLWPDDVKHSTRLNTWEQHFINVPDDAITVDLTRDCAATNCIAIGVQRALTYLAKEVDGKRAITRRAAALRFLGHYIGDLHQPLHVGNASDWGGNRVKVRVSWLEKQSNLHAIWDYELMEKIGLRHPDGVEFLQSIPVNTVEGSVLSWMNESLALGRTHAYANTEGRTIVSGDTLGQPYLERNKPIVIERLALAGARLAWLLNRIAAGEKPVAFMLSAAD